MFELAGEGDRVTIWHTEHSPVTIARDAVSRITLPPRVAVRGRFVDAAGAPVVGVEVSLDRARSATTDARGAFAFDGVEAEVEIGPGIPEVERAFLMPYDAGPLVSLMCARLCSAAGEGVLGPAIEGEYVVVRPDGRTRVRVPQQGGATSG